MTNTNTQQDQQQSQAPIQSYFEKEHNDNDNGGNKDKYQYNSYNSCESNKKNFDLRYEDLRKKAMKMEIEGKNANTPGIQELSIFIQRGMIDWVEAWNKCQLNEMTNSRKIKALVYNNKERQLDTDKDYAGINLSLNLQAQLKNLLVQIVMSTLPNKMSAKPITQRGDW